MRMKEKEAKMRICSPGLGFVAALALAALLAQKSGAEGPTLVTLYENANFSGSAVDFKGISRMSNPNDYHSWFDNMASSAKVPAGYQAVLFNNGLYEMIYGPTPSKSGWCDADSRIVVLQEDTKTDLSTLGFDNLTSSVHAHLTDELHGNTPIFFKEGNGSEAFQADDPAFDRVHEVNLTGYDHWDNSLSSLWVPKGWKVKICDKPSAGPPCQTVTGPVFKDLKYVSQQDFNNVVSYYKTERVTWLPTGPSPQGDTMKTGDVLRAGESMYSRNGIYKLAMQGDGNLVLYVAWKGYAIWSTKTGKMPFVLVHLESTGNLSLFPKLGQHWMSKTEGNPGSRLVLQDDGNLVLYNASNAPVWATNTVRAPSGPQATGNAMNVGQTLTPGQSIKSTNGLFELAMKTDGNLALLHTPSGKSLWSTGTAGKGVTVCIMQKDGNLVLYEKGLNARWAAGTQGNEGSRLVVEDDGNAVIYSKAGNKTWSTDTSKPPPTIKSFSPAAGPIGTTVKILGTNLKNAYEVKFKVTAAQITGKTTDFSMSVTVPGGAATGPIEITTPFGTVTSTASFKVGPASPSEPQLKP